MIQHLHVKIRKILFFLLGVIVTGIILTGNIMMYYAGTQTAKENLRSLVKEIGLKNMIDAEYADTELEGFAYAAVRVPRKDDKDFEPVICLNTIPDISDTKLRMYVDRIPSNDKENVRLPKLIYIIKRKENIGKIIILITKKEVLKLLMPVIVLSIILETVSIFLILNASKYISKVLVKPVNDMLEAEKNFISNASHELKTPLAVIMANADLLLECAGEEKHLRYIKSEAERMNHLIIQMLTLARLDCADESDDTEIFSLDEALLEISYPFEGIAYEKSNPFSIDIQEHMLLKGNRQQIKKAVCVLLDNAFAYAAPGGSIYINACKKHNQCVIQVSNHGSEIPKCIQDRLFQRFYRENSTQKEREEHFGLGLPICYEIVKKHHGTITVSSGQGMNCFTIWLPDNC